MQIHPTAIVHPKAQLGADVAIGPYSVIGEHVRIGRGSQLMAHVNVEGWTDIGERCQIYPFASIGSAPQHLQYKGEPTRVVIGHDNILREYVTVNRGDAYSAEERPRSATHNFLMAYVHVAHDCHLGNHIIMANAATLCRAYHGRRPRHHRRTVGNSSIRPDWTACHDRRLLGRRAGCAAVYARRGRVSRRICTG